MPTLAKAGRYEIVGELGRGAMGVVYKAMDPVIGRTVAVKTIRLSEEGTGLSRPELLTRFQTEARAAGLLTHPNIVVVFDAGEEDGLYYITMELVEGKSLQALLDGGHKFPLPRTLRIMEQTCSALQFAHERNVIHRDIKPAIPSRSRTSAPQRFCSSARSSKPRTSWAPPATCRRNK
jgi:serine/threonine-protein kinase